MNNVAHHDAPRLVPFVQITRRPYEEPYHLNLLVVASNGRSRGELEIYANVEDLQLVAARLRRAMEAVDGNPVWELGSERPELRFAFYYCWRVLRLSPTGRCALVLRFNNNHESPEREITEFSIPVLPASCGRRC